MAHSPLVSSLKSDAPPHVLTFARAREAHADLLTWLFSPEAKRMPLQDLEAALAVRWREIQSLLMESHRQARAERTPSGLRAASSPALMDTDDGGAAVVAK